MAVILWVLAATMAFSKLGFQGATWTTAYAIDGSNIVGDYEDASGNYHGFVYTIPEPCTLLLLGLGAAMVRLRSPQVAVRKHR